MNWPAIWHRLSTSRYTAWLEGEVDRLREENRALMNSLLTRAGVQPIDPPKPISRENRRMSRHQIQASIEAKAYREAFLAQQKDERTGNSA